MCIRVLLYRLGLEPLPKLTLRAFCRTMTRYLCTSPFAESSGAEWRCMVASPAALPSKVTFFTLAAGRRPVSAVALATHTTPRRLADAGAARAGVSLTPANWLASAFIASDCRAGAAKRTKAQARRVRDFGGRLFALARPTRTAKTRSPRPARRERASHTAPAPRACRRCRGSAVFVGACGHSPTLPASPAEPGAAIICHEEITVVSALAFCERGWWLRVWAQARAKRRRRRRGNQLTRSPPSRPSHALRLGGAQLAGLSTRLPRRPPPRDPPAPRWPEPRWAARTGSRSSPPPRGRAQ